MHFDDRLATVLRNPASSETIARVQFRQLLDLLGTLPSDARSESVDAAYLRLGDLSVAIPASERAAILQESVLRLRSPRLVAQLALAEPAVARAAVARADLGEDQWLDLIPALPVQVRGVVRQRRNLGVTVEALLDRLGVAHAGLPPADIFDLIEAEEMPPQIDEIGAIVRRIEAFRKTRERAGQDTPGADAMLTGIGLGATRTVIAFDFATDTEGRIVWADPGIAPAAVGLRLSSRDSDSPLQASPELLAAFRQRQPIARARLTVLGAPAVSGEWQIDAAPRFDQAGGRFVGYFGRLRRPAPDAAGAPIAGDSDADRMRQILHELRTPVNAIQGFAEVIQQQLFGPTPHEYRALAATIASDSARMLAGFEELERLVKLDSGAMAIETGSCDLLPILSATIAQLEHFNAPRRSGLALECDAPALPVALAPAEAERLVWRLLATLTGATVPNETLRLRARPRTDDEGKVDGNGIRLSLRLPASLAAREGDAVFDTSATPLPHALAASMFGAGFALRLAAAEAKAAGGALDRREDKLRLTLPGLGRTSAAAPLAALR